MARSPKESATTVCGGHLSTTYSIMQYTEETQWGITSLSLPQTAKNNRVRDGTSN